MSSPNSSNHQHQQLSQQYGPGQLKKYLCSAPHPSTWHDRSKALLKSLSTRYKNKDQRLVVLKKTLSELESKIPEEFDRSKKIGPGRKSNAEHAINFYNYTIELNEKYDDILKKEKNTPQASSPTATNVIGSFSSSLGIMPKKRPVGRPPKKRPAIDDDESLTMETIRQKRPVGRPPKRSRADTNASPVPLQCSSSYDSTSPNSKKRNTRTLLIMQQQQQQDNDNNSSSTLSTAEFLEQHNDLCEVCNLGGELLCCRTCNLVFHFNCTRPVLQRNPSDKWSCSYCVAAGTTDYFKGDKRYITRAKECCKLMDEKREESLKKLGVPPTSSRRDAKAKEEKEAKYDNDDGSDGDNDQYVSSGDEDEKDLDSKSKAVEITLTGAKGKEKAFADNEKNNDNIHGSTTPKTHNKKLFVPREEIHHDDDGKLEGNKKNSQDKKEKEEGTSGYLDEKDRKKLPLVSREDRTMKLTTAISDEDDTSGDAEEDADGNDSEQKDNNDKNRERKDLNATSSTGTGGKDKTTSGGGSNYDVNAARAKRSARQKRQPALYDPQNCPASHWRSDTVVRADRDTSSGIDDASNDTIDINETQNGGADPGEVNRDDKDTGVWCNFCKDDPLVPICCFCACRICFGKHEGEKLLLCDRCDQEYHTFCLDPPLTSVPSTTKWFCPSCISAPSAPKTRSETGSAPASYAAAVMSTPAPSAISTGGSGKRPSPGRDGTNKRERTEVPALRLAAQKRARGPDGKFAPTVAGDSQQPAPKGKRGRGRPPLTQPRPVGRPPSAQKRPVGRPKKDEEKRPVGRPPAKRPVGRPPLSQNKKKSPSQSSVSSLPAPTNKSRAGRKPSPKLPAPGVANMIEGAQFSSGGNMHSPSHQLGQQLPQGQYFKSPTASYHGATVSTKASTVSTVKTSSGRMIKRNSFHDEIEEGEQHLRTLKRFPSDGSQVLPLKAPTVGATSTPTGKQSPSLGHLTNAQQRHVSLTPTNQSGVKLPGSTAATPKFSKTSTGTTLQQIQQQRSITPSGGTVGVSSAHGAPLSTPTSAQGIPGEGSKTPRRKPGARECMQISRRFGVNVIPQRYMDILLDYCSRGKVEHLIRMRERLDEHSRMLEAQLAGLEALVKEKGELDITVPVMTLSEPGQEVGQTSSQQGH